jgi:hypothetical protein
LEEIEKSLPKAFTKKEARPLNFHRAEKLSTTLNVIAKKPYRPRSGLSGKGATEDTKGSQGEPKELESRVEAGYVDEKRQTKND